MQRKEKQKANMYTEEDREIMKQSKNKKRQKRRDAAKEEDDFDEMFKKYQKKLEKKIGDEEKTGKKGNDFEEVDISD